MKLATRITAGNLALVAILLGLAGYFLSRVERLQAQLTEVAQLGPELAGVIKDIDRRVTEIVQFNLRALALGPEDGREYGPSIEQGWLEIEKTNKLFFEVVRSSSLATKGGADREESLRTYRARLQELRGVLDAGPGPLPDDTKAREAILGVFKVRVNDAREAVLKPLETVRDLAADLGKEPAQRIEETHRVALRSAIWAAGLATLLALGVGFGVLRAATKPLERLTRGARAIASGDLSYRVFPRGSPEVVGLARDFNAMADRLHELDRLKSDFVSSVSHDLKAPLASIAETTSLLLDGLPGPLTEKQSRLLTLNLESSRRLSRMIENLLDLSRIEAGALALHFDLHDLLELAGQAVDQLRGLVEKKKLTVTIEGDAGAAIAECDAASIRRALGNLLSNAVAFSPVGGRIDVRVRPRAKESVEVLVADQGPGVPDGEKERIFQRFYRSEHGARGPGTGIGLAIARAVVEAHGGVLWVRDGANGGSVFSLLLPRDRSHPSMKVAAT